MTKSLEYISHDYNSDTLLNKFVTRSYNLF